MFSQAADAASPVVKVLGLAVIAALAPIHAMMVSAGCLILIDLITGIWAAKKKGQALRSSGLRRTVSKMTVYQLAIISGFLVQHFLLTDTLPIVNMVAGAIGLTELKSIFENVDAINGGSILKAIIGKLGSVNDNRGLVPTPDAEPTVEPPPPPATACEAPACEPLQPLPEVIQPPKRKSPATTPHTRRKKSPTPPPKRKPKRP